MLRFLIVGIVTGLVFGILDAAIHAGPWATGIFDAYAPIARIGVDIRAGVVIDLVWGLIMAALYLILYPALPGESGLTRGFSFGIIAWFFRSAMGVASTWMMYTIPPATLAYQAGAGLIEMLIIGAVLGLGLRRG